MEAIIILNGGMTYKIESKHINIFAKEINNKIKMMCTEEEEISQIIILKDE